MSLDLSGADEVVAAGTVSIEVGSGHPLIKLAQALPWMTLMTLVLPDLKRTTVRGFWWTGRKLRVRVHLAAYILQKLYDLTDRQVEYGIRDNAPYQLFTGKGIVPGWHPPDHTKVEAFRSRLSSETQRLVANETAKVAVALGFADPSDVDIDSIVQEANIAYPADANLIASHFGCRVLVYPGLQSTSANTEAAGTESESSVKRNSGTEFEQGRSCNHRDPSPAARDRPWRFRARV